jgi:hypothetical protein
MQPYCNPLVKSQINGNKKFQLTSTFCWIETQLMQIMQSGGRETFEVMLEKQKEET